MNWARAYYGRIVHLWVTDRQTLCGKDFYRMTRDDLAMGGGSFSRCQKCQKIFDRINGDKNETI